MKCAKSAQNLFASWELTVARAWVRQFRHLARDPEELQDLEQEVLIHWLEVRDQYKESLASPKTFMNRVVKNRLLELDRAQKAQIRRINLEAIPISTPTGEGTTIGDEVDRASPLEGDGDLISDLRQAMALLNGQQQSIAMQLTAGVPQTEIAESLGLHRSTIHEAIKRIRKVFMDKGLKEYID